ncbi:MAG: hypothetical protein JNL60_06955 [Bacteroidia bacterium]|nr:hypothetical protein [Bacteroidia bacterium]
MKNRIRKYKLEIIGSITGAVGGFLYWKFVGCASGSCAITSSPVNSSIYGAMMGALFFGLFKRENKNNSKETQHEKP